MPADVTRTLNAAFNKISQDPDVLQKAEMMNFRAVTGTSEGFTARIKRESQQWNQIAQAIK